MSSSPEEEYPPNKLVWAKVRGYPWWPGRIKALSDIPKELAATAKQYSSRREAVFPVYFFGSHDYSLITVDCLKPLREDWDVLSASKTSVTKFKLALVEARLLLGLDSSGSPQTEISPAAATILGETTIEEEDLPTNAFIEIDPETGLKTIKKVRGRPPKVRPDHLPAIQYKSGSKKTSSTGTKTTVGTVHKKTADQAMVNHYYKAGKVNRLRRKLQKILLRPVLRQEELPIAREIIRRTVVKRKCTLEQFEKSKMAFVLVEAMKRKVWAGHPEMLKSFRSVLQKWKSLP